LPQKDYTIDFNIQNVSLCKKYTVGPRGGVTQCLGGVEKLSPKVQVVKEFVEFKENKTRCFKKGCQRTECWGRNKSGKAVQRGQGQKHGNEK